MRVRVSVETVTMSIAHAVHSITVRLRCQKARVSGTQATLLVLTTTTTRARIVAPYFRTRFGLRSLDKLHQAFGWLSGTSQCGQLVDVRAAVHKEAFIAGAQVVQSCFTVRGLDDTIFRASPVTHGADFAFPAIARQGRALGRS